MSQLLKLLSYSESQKIRALFDIFKFSGSAGIHFLFFASYLDMMNWAFSIKILFLQASLANSRRIAWWCFLVAIRTPLVSGGAEGVLVFAEDELLWFVIACEGVVSLKKSLGM